MTEHKFQHIKLNGISYNRQELEKRAIKKLRPGKAREYEFSLYSFIKEWLADSDTVSVKTSGSTGAPKQMKIKKEQMIASAKMTCNYFNLTAKSTMMLCLSTDYIAGKMMVVRAFVSGANLITVKPTNKPLAGIKDKIDFVAMIPSQVQSSLKKKSTGKKFYHIKNVIVGGTSIPYEIEEEIVECPNNVYSTFAMTETLSHIALRKLSGKKKSNVFELLPGIKLTTDKRGCMVVHAPQLNDEDIVTNDVIEIIDKNHFAWLGRYDNVINSGGIKLYPEKLEESLASVIKRNRFFIASLPDAKFGEKLVLVLEDMSKDKLEKIKKKVEEVLGKYEKPKEYFVANEFIETPNGKVKRKETLQKAMSK